MSRGAQPQLVTTGLVRSKQVSASLQHSRQGIAADVPISPSNDCKTLHSWKAPCKPDRAFELTGHLQLMGNVRLDVGVSDLQQQTASKQLVQSTLRHQ